jgi:Family of unknown function (DUF5678)
MFGSRKKTDSSKQAINWTSLFEKYKGLWVALKDDQQTVIAAGRDLKQVRLEAARKGYADPIFHRVPTDLTYLVGTIA